jgi:hypothetical protein
MPPEHGQNYHFVVTDEWTEVVRSDDAVYDAEEGRFLTPDPLRQVDDLDEPRRLLREPLRERGINVDDLDFSTDVRIKRHVRQSGRLTHHFYAVLVRTERLPGAR